MHDPLRITTALVAVLLVHAPAAHAASGLEPSAPALAATDPASAGHVPLMNMLECPAPATPLTLALTRVPEPASVEISGVHYRPRYRSGGYSRHPQAEGVSQVHAGFFDPDGDQKSRLDVGIRGGPMLDEHLQIGLGVDWIHKGEHISNVSRSTVGPGGVPIEVKEDIARASVNMFPIMGFLQVSAPGDFGLIPYFGAGGGYQVLVLSGDDFNSGQSFEGTFSGWGWQAWAGLGVPLGGRTRFTGEAFVNGADLTRDVTDSTTGQKVRETVSGDGMGLRFGLAWGF